MKNISLFIPSPLSVLTWGIFIYLIIFFMSPLTPKYDGTIYSWTYLIFSIFSIYLGLLFTYRKLSFKPKMVCFSVNVNALNKVFKIILIIAILGVLLRIVDKYYIRGATMALDILENKEALSNVGSGPLSILSAVTYPFSFIVPFYFLFLKQVKSISFFWYIFVIPISLFPMVDGAFFGSRSSGLVFITLIVLYVKLFDIIRFRMNLQTIIFSLFMLSIMFSISGFLFSLRTESLGMDPILSTQISGYAYFVKLDESWTKYLYEINGSLFYYLMIGIINFVQYIIHGVFELLYLVDEFDTNKISYGINNFFIIVKFFGIFLHFNPEVIYEDMIRIGVYTTFFGPVYYDFGFFGIFFNFIIGLSIGLLYSSIVKKGKIGLLPLYFYTLVILFYSLVVSFLVSAQGMYLITAFIFSYIISKRYLTQKTLQKIG